MSEDFTSIFDLARLIILVLIMSVIYEHHWWAESRAKKKYSRLLLARARNNLSTALQSGDPAAVRTAIIAYETRPNLPWIDWLVLWRAKNSYFRLLLARGLPNHTARRPWARWQYETAAGWLDFEDGMAEQLERHRSARLAGPAAGAIVQLSSGNLSYEVDLQSMQQTNVRTGRRRSVRRLEPVDPMTFPLPRSWDLSQGSKLVDVTLHERERMQNVLRSTSHGDRINFPGSACLRLSTATVEHVWRVQNGDLWQLFCAKRCIIRAQLHQGLADGPGEGALPAPDAMLALDEADMEANEVFAMHGTTRQKADAIVDEGFDARVSGGLYGYGLYLTRQSCKAAQYAHPHSGGLRCIIMARAVLGRPYFGADADSTMRRTPRADDGRPTHSLIITPREGSLDRRTQHHEEIVIFDGSQLYPEFLVEFRFT